MCDFMQRLKLFSTLTGEKAVIIVNEAQVTCEIGDHLWLWKLLYHLNSFRLEVEYQLQSEEKRAQSGRIQVE